MIREDRDGHIDLAAAARGAGAVRGPPAAGSASFSAASNVTGIVSDTRAISRLLHEHGALSFFDFAAAAPYVAIEMDPTATRSRTRTRCSSRPHKFIGGPGTPGVLVARRELFRNRVPSMPGGGTVAYVNPVEHVYLSDIEHREEGGTPAIVESIRAGLVFGLKAAVGVDAIREREEDFIRRALDRWEANPGIEILGSHQAERLSIVSFVVRHGRPLPAPQLRGRAAQRPVRDPVARRLLVRRAVRAPAAGDRPRDVATSSSARSPAAARGSSPAGCGSTSTTSSARRCSSSSSTPWTSWRPRAGGCCRTTRSTRPPASGATVTERPEPPLSLRDIRYEDGAMTWPSHRHHEPESRLAEYLEEARGSWPCRRGRSRRPRSPPAPSGRTSRPCAGSCCRRTSPRGPWAALMVPRVPAARRRGCAEGRGGTARAGG